MILNQTARTEKKIIKIDCGRLMQNYQFYEVSVLPLAYYVICEVAATYFLKEFFLRSLHNPKVRRPKKSHKKNALRVSIAFCEKILKNKNFC